MSGDIGFKTDEKMVKFVCVCPPQSEERLSQGGVEERLQSVVNFGGIPSASYILEEGGIVATVGSASPSIYQADMLLAAFAGELENYPYLVKKYCPETLNVADPQRLWLEEIRQRRPVTESQLMCILYRKLGTNLVPKLRGDFAFVIYNACQNRVLAANDNKGTYKLEQGILSDGSLVIACGDCMPKHANDVVLFKPGFMKYGWQTPPRKYSSSEEDRKCAAQEAHTVAASALSGLTITTPSPKATSPKTQKSYDSDESEKHFTKYEQRQQQDKWSKPQFPTVHTDKWTPPHPQPHPHTHPYPYPPQTWKSPQSTPPFMPPHTPPHFERANSGLSPPTPPFHYDPPTPTPLQYDNTYQTFIENSMNTSKSDSENSSFECSGILGESVAALSTLPKNLLDNLAGGNTDDPVHLNSVLDLLLNDNTPITITDTQLPDNPVVYANPAFISASGYPLASIIGMNLRFLQSPPGQPRVPSVTSMMVRKCVADGVTKRIRILNYNRYGVALQNDMTLIPIYDRGVVTHWLGILQFTPVEEKVPGNVVVPQGFQKFQVY